MTMPNLSKRPRWGQSGKSDPCAVYVAPRLGMRPASVEQLMRQVNHRCAAIVDGFIALGDDVRLVHFLAPIDAALAKAQRPAFTPELVRDEAEADGAEDVAENLLFVAPSRDAALLFIRRSQAARAAALRLERAIAAKWEIGL
jgi:hypothetical protein